MLPANRMNWWYWFGRFLISRLMRTFGRVEVVGKENIPPFGPLIITPNHLNNADPPLLAVVFNRPLFFMGKRNLFSRIAGRGEGSRQDRILRAGRSSSRR